MISLSFQRPLCGRPSLVAEGVGAAVRVSTYFEETGGIVLGVQTLCPKGKYSKTDKSKTKIINNIKKYGLLF